MAPLHRAGRSRHGLSLAAALACILSLLVANSALHVHAVASLAKPACPVSVAAYNIARQYFTDTDQVSPTYSKLWSIDYSSSYKVLTNKVDGSVYVLYMCNTQIPPASTVPANAKFFEVPLHLAGTSSRTTPRYFERLGLREKLRYVPSASLLTSPCLQLLAQSGFTLSIPTGWDATNVDVVFAGGSNSSEVLGGVAGNRTVTLSPQDETDPLARLEWIKFLAAFYNAEATANSVFSAALASYTCAATEAANFVAAGTGNAKKTLAWMQRNTDGTYSTADADYKNKLITAAAANPSLGAAPLVAMSAQSQLLGADVLIDDSTGTEQMSGLLTAYGLAGDAGLAYRWITNKDAYHTSKRRNQDGVDDWDQSYLAMPDHVLQDIVSILYPTVEPSWIPRWMHNVARGDGYTTLTAANCPNGDTAAAFAAIYPTPPCTGSASSSSSASGSSSGGSSSGSTTSTTSTAPAPAASSPNGGLIAGLVIGSLVLAAGGGFLAYRKVEGGAKDYLEERRKAKLGTLGGGGSDSNVDLEASAGAGNGAGAGGADAVPASESADSGAATVAATPVIGASGAKTAFMVGESEPPREWVKMEEMDAKGALA